MKHFNPFRKLKLFFALAVLSVCPTAWANDGWSVTANNSGNVTTFVISRTDVSFAQTVQYRTVSMSALDGKHFTGTTGEVTFAVDKDTAHVTVNETAIANVDITYRYQNATSRSYRFEVTDVNGYSLAHVDRSISYGTNYRFANEYTSKTVTNLLYFNSSGTLQSGMNSDKYYDIPHTESSDTYIQVTDAGYNQRVNNISTASFFNAIKAPRTYLNTLNYKLYAAVYFDQKEENDGYQYIQILTDNSSTYDDNDPNGKVNTPSTSVYKACFILSYSGSVESNFHKQFFPHRYDYVDNSQNSTSYYEFPLSDSHLYQQGYKSNTYKATSSGALILNPTVNTINVRFDAAGSDKDTWGFKNLNVRLALCDASAPTIISDAVAVSAGPYAPGETVYVSVPFSEIVTVSGTPTLTTAWGTFQYAYGSNTNVLTFSGTVPENSTALTINGISGTIRDMAGNSLPGSLSKNMNVTPLSAFVLNESNTVISGIEPSYPDNETAQTPVPTVTFYAGTNGQTLTEGTDYTISYANNDFPGTATLTITGIGKYSGTLSKTFRIVGVALSEFTKQDTYYLISSKEDLRLLSRLVNRSQFGHNSGTLFRLTTDIDFNGDTLKSIGSYSYPFKGKFYGDGHTISGVTIVAAQDEVYTGLFGYITLNSSVQDVRMANSTIAGWKQVGAIVGECRGTVQNCRVESSVTVQPANNQDSYQNFGGIAGRLHQGAAINGCYSAAVVTNNGKANCSNFGGIIGATRNGYSYPVINNFYAGSTVSAQTAAGAIIGLNGGNSMLRDNYYLNDNLPGGINGDDQSNAQRAYTITFDEYAYVNEAAAYNYNLSGYSVYGAVLKIDTALYCGAEQTIEIGHKDSAYYDCTFLAYYSGEEHIIEGSTLTMPAANVSVYTTYTPTVYTITYILGEDAVQEGNPSSYTVESDDITLVNPTREGYIFTGWEGTGLDAIADTVTIANGSAGDRTYTATWKAAVAYIDADGNEQICTDFTLIESSETSVIYGAGSETNWYVVSDHVTINGQLRFNNTQTHLIVRDGAKLTVNSSSDAIYCPGGSLTIYGQAGSSGSLDATCTDYTSGTGTGIHTQHDLTLNGGFVEAAALRGIVSGQDVVINAGNLVVVGGSEGVTANANIRVNGGTVTVAGAVGMHAGEAMILGWTSPADFIYVSTYTAQTNSIGFLQVKDGQALTDGTNVYTGILTPTQRDALGKKKLYPCYAVTFDANGGSEVAQRPAMFESTGHAYVSVPDEPTREGYTFVQWLNGTDAFDFDTEVTGHLTLTAEWHENPAIPTAIDENLQSAIINHKFIKDGHLLILRDGKLYDLMGRKLRE